MPSIRPLSMTGSRFIELRSISSNVSLTLAFEDIVTIGDDLYSLIESG